MKNFIEKANAFRDCLPAWLRVTMALALAGCLYLVVYVDLGVFANQVIYDFIVTIMIAGVLSYVITQITYRWITHRYPEGEKATKVMRNAIILLVVAIFVTPFTAPYIVSWIHNVPMSPEYYTKVVALAFFELLKSFVFVIAFISARWWYNIKSKEG